MLVPQIPKIMMRRRMSIPEGRNLFYNVQFSVIFGIVDHKIIIIIGVVVDSVLGDLTVGGVV